FHSARLFVIFPLEIGLLWAYLRVRGQGQAEQGLKASIAPGKPERQEVIETLLTPAHPDPLAALLDEPLTGTFHHAAAQRQSQFLVYGIVDVRPVPLQIGIHGGQRVPRCVGQAFDRQSLGKVGQAPVRLAMTEAMAGPPEPPTRLRGTAITPGGCT